MIPMFVVILLSHLLMVTCQEFKFERTKYDVDEDEDYLFVCLDISNLMGPKNVTLSTVSATAQGGEDFDEFRTEIMLHNGDTHRCIVVILRDDQLAEFNKSFFIRVEETQELTEICIIDNDDVDECLKIDSCDTNAICSNTIGSFTCTCQVGFIGDGHSCDDIDECAGSNNCDPDTTICINNDGSFTCERVLSSELGCDIPAQIHVTLTIFLSPTMMAQSSINLDASDTIAEVKSKIETETSILAGQQTLIFNGSVLGDDETVFEVCIEDGSNLILVFG